jgi:anti-sigma B factor antagonist
MVTTTTIADGTVITLLPERFAIDQIPFVEHELLPFIIKNPERVLFDMSQTDYISSAGMRMLLGVLRTVTDTGGRVAVCSLKSPVMQVFIISGFDRIFPVYATREEALLFLEGPLLQ